MSQSAAEILQSLHDKYPVQIPDEMMQSDHLRRVVQAYIDDSEIDARHAAHHLTFFLQSFRYRAPLIYKEIRTPYSIDQAAAVDEIRSAANHLSSDNPNYVEVVSGNREQLEQMQHDDTSIMDLSRPENLQKLAEKDLLSHALEAIADAVASLSEEQVTPNVMSMQFMQAMDVDPDNLKEKGRAKDRDSRMKTFLIREIDRRVPAGIDKRDAAIRHIASLAGVTVGNTYVRTTLNKGQGRGSSPRDATIENHPKEKEWWETPWLDK